MRLSQGAVSLPLAVPGHQLRYHVCVFFVRSVLMWFRTHS